MELKKLFFPIGGGEELEERIRGALLVNRYFGTHMSMLACQYDPKILGGVFYDDVFEDDNDELMAERKQNIEIFKKVCVEIGIEVSKDQHLSNSAYLRNAAGIRSELVKKFSKYCDLVVCAVPSDGKITGTFKASVVRSGKPCVVIPRKMTEFKTDKILLTLSGTTSNSRALTRWIPVLKEAKEIHCVSSSHHLQDSEAETKGRIINYLDLHGIKIDSFKLLPLEGGIPGEVLLEEAEQGKFDAMITGLDVENHLKEILVGGVSKELLQGTKIPLLV